MRTGRNHSTATAGLQPGAIHKRTPIDSGSELIHGSGGITANYGRSNRGRCTALEVEY